MDSLLSITASVTGILTFFAAVWAFIYVRYTTLKDRDEEILKKIMTSVSNSIQEVSLIMTPRRGIRREADAIENVPAFEESTGKLPHGILRLE